MSKRKSRQKAGRRAYLKRFSGSMVNAGKTANANELSLYAQRARTLADPLPKDWYKTPGKMNYSDRMEVIKNRRVLELEPLDVVLGVLKDMWTSDFWQGYDTFHRINLKLVPDQMSMFLFFSRDRWFFVKEVKTSRFQTFDKAETVRRPIWEVTRSLVYPTKDMALARYKTCSICWVAEKDVGKSVLERAIGLKLDLEKM